LSIGEHRPHKKGTEVDFVTRVNGADGTEVWRSITTILFFHRSKFEETFQSTVDISTEQSTEIKILADAGRKWANFNGDFNPIHLYTWSAKLFGFRSPIVHGTCLSRIILGNLDRQNEIDKQEF
jgi:acyl dehydratase